MFIDPPPIEGSKDDLLSWCERLHQKILQDDLYGSATWNPGSIAKGDMEAKAVTVTGAALGDYALASFSIDIADLILDAQVTAANTVTCVLTNTTDTDPTDLGSGTVYVRVFKRTS